jgi:hypothetical protein
VTVAPPVRVIDAEVADVANVAKGTANAESGTLLVWPFTVERRLRTPESAGAFSTVEENDLSRVGSVIRDVARTLAHRAPPAAPTLLSAWLGKSAEPAG